MRRPAPSPPPPHRYCVAAVRLSSPGSRLRPPTHPRPSPPIRPRPRSVTSSGRLVLAAGIAAAVVVVALVAWLAMPTPAPAHTPAAAARRAAPQHPTASSHAFEPAYRPGAPQAATHPRLARRPIVWTQARCWWASDGEVHPRAQSRFATSAVRSGDQRGEQGGALR